MFRQPTILAAAISFVGVALSVTVSLLVSRRQMRVERDKLNRTLDAAYEQKVVEMRWAAHQKLWGLLSRLNKRDLQTAFEDARVRTLLSETVVELERWYEHNGLTLSRDAYVRFTRLCSILSSHARRAEYRNEADLSKVRRAVWLVRQALREDVHVPAISPGTDTAKTRERSNNDLQPSAAGGVMRRRG